MHAKVPLQGAELEAHLQKEREAKEAEAARQAAAARIRPMLEADEGDSDSDSESDNDDSIDLGDGSGRRDNDATDWNMDADEGLTKQLLSFDIYLKGNVSKATPFFKSAGSQAQRFRMFPYVEKKRRVDEYGETIDVALWLRKGKIFDEEAESEEVKNSKRRFAENEAKVYPMKL